MIFVFKEYLVEVSHSKNERGDIIKSFINIHHLEENITVFWYPPAKGEIISVQIEDCNDHNRDGIYYISQGFQDKHIERELVRIYPMRDNEKIYTLVKKSHFSIAENVARRAKFPREIVCEIIKEHGDKLFQQKKYDEAIEQYKNTIGFLNPSYVIQNFIKVNQLDSLIKYLEVLIRFEKKRSQTAAQEEESKLAVGTAAVPQTWPVMPRTTV